MELLLSLRLEDNKYKNSDFWGLRLMMAVFTFFILNCSPSCASVVLLFIYSTTRVDLVKIIGCESINCNHMTHPPFVLMCHALIAPLILVIVCPWGWGALQVKAINNLLILNLGSFCLSSAHLWWWHPFHHPLTHTHVCTHAHTQPHTTQPHVHTQTQILCLHSWALQAAGLCVQMTCTVEEERPSLLSSKDQSLFVEPMEMVVKWGREEG